MEQLKPPGALNLEGNLAENFKEWIQSFELYLTATGIEEKAEKVQVATFLHVADPDGQRVYQYDRKLTHLINVQTHMV
jgi:hypothetical protein